MSVEDRSLLGGNYLHAVLVFLRETDASRSCRLRYDTRRWCKLRLGRQGGGTLSTVRLSPLSHFSFHHRTTAQWKNS